MSQDWARIVSLLRGLRNGLYYGGKVRIVHSLVMMLLFKSVSRKELRNIVRLGWEHARNLGAFVLAYKAGCMALEQLWGARPANSFLSGLLFGGWIFGTKTPVNVQIVLYLLSRVLLASATLLYKRLCRGRWEATDPPLQRRFGHVVLAAVCWGLVMWLFEVDKSALQPSLTSSMQFLYVESSKKLADWRELVPFYVPRFD